MKGGKVIAALRQLLEAPCAMLGGQRVLASGPAWAVVPLLLPTPPGWSYKRKVITKYLYKILIPDIEYLVLI
jgi:hypothetical protein